MEVRPDPHQRKGQFWVGNIGRVDLVLPAMRDAANSADHNHSLTRRIAADGVA